MKNWLYAILTITFLMLLSDGFAQSLPGGGGGPPGGCFIPPCIPIDGGISGLVAAGLAYGYYSLRGGKKSND